MQLARHANVYKYLCRKTIWWWWWWWCEGPMVTPRPKLNLIITIMKTVASQIQCGHWSGSVGGRVAFSLCDSCHSASKAHTYLCSRTRSETCPLSSHGDFELYNSFGTVVAVGVMLQPHRHRRYVVLNKVEWETEKSCTRPKWIGGDRILLLLLLFFAPPRFVANAMEINSVFFFLCKFCCWQRYSNVK